MYIYIYVYIFIAHTINIYVTHNIDWYAINFKYFWSTLLPELKNIWIHETALSNHQQSATASNFKSFLYEDGSEAINSFPYSESEVNWAFESFTDAYGYLKRAEICLFTKCACTDKNGNRTPCVPPQVGFMCRKVATFIKATIIRQIDKKERIWNAYKKKSMDDAVQRAKHEATAYLESKPGRKWLEEKAFEKAEEILAERGKLYKLYIYMTVYYIMNNLLILLLLHCI